MATCTGRSSSRSSADARARSGGALALVAAVAIACTPAPAPPSAHDIVTKAVARTTTLRSAHFKLDVTKGYVLVGPSLRVLKAEGDIALHDRLRVRARVDVGAAIVETDLIQVAGDSFYLDPFTTRWQRLGQGLTVVPLLDPERGVANLIRSARDVRVEARETVDGAAGWRVRGRLRPADVTALLGGDPVAEDVAVEAVVGDDGLVRRLVLSGAIVPGEVAETVRRLEFSGFDGAVRIEPPVP